MKSGAFSLWNLATVARICWPFHSLGRSKSASLSGVPMSKDSERATFAFIGIQLQWLECSAASLLPKRQRAPQGQKLHPPRILSEPLSLLLTFVTIVKIEEGRYMPKGSGKVIAQNKKLFMIISSKKHMKQGLSFKERKLSRFALDA